MTSNETFVINSSSVCGKVSLGNSTFNFLLGESELKNQVDSCSSSDHLTNCYFVN